MIDCNKQFFDALVDFKAVVTKLTGVDDPFESIIMKVPEDKGFYWLADPLGIYEVEKEVLGVTIDFRDRWERENDE